MPRCSMLPVHFPCFAMISADDMRQILGLPDLTDEQILAIRDDCTAWLNRPLDEYFDSTGAYTRKAPP